MEKLLTSGFCYISRRDKGFRPVIILNVQKMTQISNEDYVHVETAINFLLTYSVNKVNLPGHAEAFCVILDLNHVGVS